MADLVTAATWGGLGVLLGWTLAVMMGEVRKHETVVRNEITSVVSADTCHAIALAVVAILQGKAQAAPAPEDNERPDA
jgi:hypothetical protein